MSIKSPPGQTPSRRVRPLRAVAVTVAATLVSLLFAAAAESAGGVSFTGTTSQGQALRFKVSGGEVIGLNYHIHDTCPDGHILSDDVTFRPITINRGRFSHTFGPSGQPTSVSGNISGTHATGSVRDRSVSPREHALCQGSATFSARS